MILETDIVLSCLITFEAIGFPYELLTMSSARRHVLCSADAITNSGRGGVDAALQVNFSTHVPYLSFISNCRILSIL